MTEQHWTQLELFAQDLHSDSPLSSRHRRSRSWRLRHSKRKSSRRSRSSAPGQLNLPFGASAATTQLTFVTVAVNDLGKIIGEDHPRAKYLDEDVEHALDLRRQHYSYLKISRMLDMPVRTVRDYISGKRRAQSVATWKKVKRRLPKS